MKQIFHACDPPLTSEAIQMSKTEESTRTKFGMKFNKQS